MAKKAATKDANKANKMLPLRAEKASKKAKQDDLPLESEDTLVAPRGKVVNFYEQAYKAGKKLAKAWAKDAKAQRKVIIQNILESTGAKGKDIKGSISDGYQAAVRDVLGNIF